MDSYQLKSFKISFKIHMIKLTVNLKIQISQINLRVGLMIRLDWRRV